MRQINPDVVAVFPITPSTPIVEAFSTMAANGLVDTEFVAVESEHSALSACIGASAAGARAQTVSSSQGLALMWELMFVASGLRLPIVMHCASRALSAPLNIHCDHSDTMGLRDSGWIQLYATNPQEAYDHAILSTSIAEHPDVLLPTLHTQDGYTVTHSTERVQLYPDEAVSTFIGEYCPERSLLDTRNPTTVGPIVGFDYYFEFKRQVVEAIDGALEVIPRIFRKFEALTGRSYHMVEEEELADAEIALVTLGSSAGTIQSVVRDLRRRGIRVGLLTVRVFRPFPTREVARALRGCKAVGVLDRAISFGATGNPLYMDVLGSLTSEEMGPVLAGYAYGLGGRDLVPQQVVEVYADLARVAESGPRAQQLRYIGLRE
ncbi:MAG: pyruvate ferredoxin oxidoreductase [Dehalococcoidia bacterium]